MIAPPTIGHYAAIVATYERSVALLRSSLALRRFRQDRGVLSTHHWVGTVATDLLSYKLHNSNLASDPRSALGITNDKFDHRLTESAGALKRNVTIGNRWRHLSTVILLMSAFERFMLGIATSASSSDPALTPGFPKRIDGLVADKYNLRIGQPDLNSLVKGEWPSRIAAYKRLFKAVPPELQSAQGDLEKMRSLRNAVAHRFGFEEGHWSPHMGLVLGARRPDLLGAQQYQIGHKTLLRWLNQLGIVSEAIDKHLTVEYIGGYESGAIYIEWLRNPSKFEKAIGVNFVRFHDIPPKRFNKVLGTILDASVGEPYSTSLCAFVDRL